MTDRKRYRPGGWTIWALVVTPFAIAAAVVVVAALEQPTVDEIDPTAQDMMRRVLPQLRKDQP